MHPFNVTKKLNVSTSKDIIQDMCKRNKTCVKKFISFLIIFIIVVSLCNGNVNAKEQGDSKESTIITLGMKPDLNYEVVEQKPHIMVDIKGYATGSKKVLFICGKDLDKEFKIVNKNTLEEVYVGNLAVVTEDYADGEDLYMGEFSEIYQSGTYMAYQSQVGYSYEFAIGDDIYKNMYQDYYKDLIELDTKDNSEKCFELATLMFTHEIFPDAYMDKSYIRREVENLLKQQDPETKNVHENTKSKSDLSLSVTAEFAGVMANYYHDFYEEDTEFASKCLQAATESYMSVVKFRDNVYDDSWYFAASQLYRATGNTAYRNAIEEYDAIDQKNRTVSEMNFTLLADMAYLNTEYRADYMRCETIMEVYKDKAENIANSTSRQTLYVRADMDKADNQEVLNDMMILGIVDYVLSGREYASVQENYLHYMFGRNKLKTNCLEGEKSSIQTYSKLIFILGIN